MLVYSFEVGDDSDVSTPGTEYMGSFTLLKFIARMKHPSQQADLTTTRGHQLS